MSRPATIEKTFRCELAHQLPDHDSECANIHGHSVRFTVVLSGMTESSGPSRDMVMDFQQVSRVVRERILRRFDHHFICSGDEPVLRFFTPAQLGATVIGVRTTAENVAQYIGLELQEAGLPVVQIRYYETETGCAIWGSIPN